MRVFTTDIPRTSYAAAAANNAAAGALPPTTTNSPPNNSTAANSPAQIAAPIHNNQSSAREVLPHMPSVTEQQQQQQQQLPYTAVVHTNPNPITLAPIAAFNSSPPPPHLSHTMPMPVPHPPPPTMLSPGRSTVRSSPATPRQSAPRIPPDLPLSRTSPSRLGVNCAPRTSSGISRKRTSSPRTVARRSAAAAAANPNSLHNSSNTGAADAVLPRGSVVKITGNNRTKKELLNRKGLVLSAQTLGGWHEVALYDGANVRVQRNALTLLDAPSEATVAMLPPITAENTVISVNMSHLNKSSLERYRKIYGLPLPDDAPRDELETAVKRHFAKQKVNETEIIRLFIKRRKSARIPLAKSL